MIKDFINSKLDINKPVEYIYKLTVCRNKLNDMIADFEKDWIYCSTCQDYVKNENAKKEQIENGQRTVLRCQYCGNILKFI